MRRLTGEAEAAEVALRTTSLRVLDGRDLLVARDLIDRDPVHNVFVASRVGAGGLDPWRLGAEVWGFRVDGRLRSLCYYGANLVPVGAGPTGTRFAAADQQDALVAFAERASRGRRRCSSIVGAADLVGSLWALLEPAWGPARDVRPNQPVLVISDPPLVPADPLVRPVRPDEIDLLVPASIAMFTEEVGVSPLASDGGALYRSRVAELVDAGRAFARIEDGRVVFKAEVGALSSQAAQVQGVWVAPERRGEGLSNAGMAAVVQHTLGPLAPLVTLYVNEHNAAARASYRRVGFTEVGKAMTVLF